MFLSGELLDYSNRSTSATRTINFAQVTWKLTKVSHFPVNNFEVTSYTPTPVCLGDTLEALLHQPEPQQEPLQNIGRCIDCRRSRQWPGPKASLQSFVMAIRRLTVPQKMPRHDTIDPMLLLILSGPLVFATYKYDPTGILRRSRCVQVFLLKTYSTTHTRTATTASVSSTTCSSSEWSIKFSCST